jgi:hypothetical protein
MSNISHRYNLLKRLEVVFCFCGISNTPFLYNISKLVVPTKGRKSFKSGACWLYKILLMSIWKEETLLLESSV